ncbi:hypothetical protein CENSYa_0848 [Cenarchaeum symbiosum A]|uniref:Uncharacterized protein n=1 Tax=Cenarchaeum symbiosum (strain A) TaxID=414004 RepID=A0RVW4_CENSY|nr:hypothetical protein CENSYa_0848 [Cenarchaeum symbiosum A]
MNGKFRGSCVAAGVLAAVLVLAIQPAYAQAPAVSAALDSIDREIEIRFGFVVDVSSADPARIHVRDGNTLPGQVTLHADSLITMEDSQTVRFRLDAEQFRDVLAHESPRLHFDPGAITGPEGAFPPGFTLPLPALTETLHVGRQENILEDLAFGPGGNSLFVIGDGSRGVSQYSLPTPYGIEDAVYQGTADLSRRFIFPHGLAFSPDGMRMHVADTTDGEIVQYLLGAPFDTVSTAPELETRFQLESPGMIGTIGFITPRPESVVFDPTGDFMYVIERFTDTIYQYKLAVPYDLRFSINLVEELSILNVDGLDATGMALGPEGRRLFLVDGNLDTVRVYEMTEPYDISTASPIDEQIDISGLGGSPSGLAFGPGGNTLYISDSVTDIIYRLDLAVPYSTAGQPSETIPAGGAGSAAVSPDGSAMYTAGQGVINIYNMSSPFALPSAVIVGNLSVNAAAGRPDMGVSDDGELVFLLREAGINPALLIRYRSGGNGLSSSGADGFGSLSENSPTGFDFGDGGRSFYVTGTQASNIQRYSLDNAYRIFGAADPEVLDISGQVDSPTDVEVSPDGRSLLVSGDGSDMVHFYSLEQPHSLSSASYSGSFRAGTGSAIIDVDLPGGGALLTVSGNRISATSAASRFLDVCPVGQHSVEGSCSADRGAEPPVVVDARTGMAGRELEITFDRAMDIQTARPGQIRIADGISSTGGISLSRGIIEDHVDSSVLRFVLPPDVSSEIRGYADPVLLFDEGAIRDTEGAAFPGGFVIPVTAVRESVHIGDRESDINGVALSADGTRMFVAGTGTPRVQQYNLDVPFDVSTAVYHGRLDVRAQFGGVPRVSDISFSADGTRMYMSGLIINRVNQYLLPEPYTLFGPADGDNPNIEAADCAVSQASACHEGFMNVADVSNPSAVVVGDGGLSVFLTGSGGVDMVHRYVLSEPYDLTTAGPTPQDSLQIDEEGFTTGLAFSADGSTMFLAGRNGDIVYEYELAGPFDISSEARLIFTFSIAGQDGEVGGISFSPDGTSMFIAGSSTDTIYSYTLGDPFNLSPRGYEGSLQTIQDGVAPGGISSALGGRQVFVADESSVSWYFAEPAGNVLGAVRDSTDRSGGQGPFGGVAASESGHRVYAASGSTITQFNGVQGPEGMLVVELVSDSSIDTGENISSVQGLAASADGRRIFVAGDDAGIIHQYDLPVPFEISGGAVYSGSYDASDMVSSPEGLYISPDGYSMFVLDGNTGLVENYGLEIPYDVQSASYQSTFSTASQEGDPSGVAFSGDGLVMYVSGNEAIHQYRLSSSQVIACPAPQVILNGTCSGDIPVTLELSLPGLDGETGLLQMPFGEEIDTESSDLGLIRIANGTTDEGMVLPEPLNGTGPVLQFVLEGRGLAEVLGYAEPRLHFGAGALFNSALEPFPAPYDISGAAPQGFVSAGSEPSGVEFSADGEIMFTTDDNSVFRYELGLPFDVRGAALNGSLDTIPGAGGPAFSIDGRIMLVSGGGSIARYDLAAPYSLDGAANASLDVSAEEPAPRDVAASVDGMRIFVAGGEGVQQYDLTEPYNLGTAAFAGSLELQGATGLYLAPGGRTLLVTIGDRVIEYVLTVPYEISSAEHVRESPWLGGLRGLAASADGLRLFSARIDPPGVAQYALNTRMLLVEHNGPALENALLNAATGEIMISFDRTINVSSIDPSKAYIAGGGSERSLSDAELLAGADSDVIKFNLSDAGRAAMPSSPAVRFDAGALYDLDGRQYPVPFDPGMPDMSGLAAGPGVASPAGAAFAAGGSRLLAVNGSSSVYQYSLDSPYNVTGASFDGLLGLGAGTEASGITLGPGGREAFVSSKGGTVHRYSLDVPGSVIAGAGVEESADLGVSDLGGVAVSPDGRRLFAADTGGSRIIQYNMTGPFELSTAVLAAEHDTTDAPHGVAFSSGGTGMFVAFGGSPAQGLARFGLSLPYELGGAGPAGATVLDGGREDVAFSPDGFAMLAPGGGTINRYELGTRSLAMCPGDPLCGDLAARHLLFPLDAPVQSDASSARRVLYAADAPAASEQLKSIPSPLRSASLPLFSDSATAEFPPDPRILAVTLDGDILEATFDRPFDTQGEIAGGIHVRNGISFSGVEISPAKREASMPHVLRLNITAQRGEISGYSSPRLYIEPGVLAVGSSVFPDGAELPLPSYRGGFAVPGTGPPNPSLLGASITGAAFSPDGLRMAIVDHGRDVLQMYLLDAPYDISRAISAGELLLREESAQAAAFSGSGRSIFVAGHANIIHRYDLVDPGNISSAVRTGGYALQGELTTGLSFSRGGLEMYSVDAGPDIVYRHTLGIPYDISSAVPSGSFFVGEDETQDYPTGVAVSPDGLIMLVSESRTGGVRQYELSVPYDPSSAGPPELFLTGPAPVHGTGPDDQSPTDVTFSVHGMQMYVTGQLTGAVHRYDLAEPFDPIASTHVSSTVRPEWDGIRSVTLTPDGTVMITADDLDPPLMYNLVEPFDPDTAVLSGNASGAIPGRTTAVHLAPGGILLAGGRDTLSRYDVGEPPEIDAAVENGTQGIITFEPFPGALNPTSDGGSIFVSGEFNNDVREIVLGAPYDITQPFGHGRVFMPEDDGLEGPVVEAFAPGGRHMFASAAEGIILYSLPGPYSVGLAELEGSFRGAGHWMLKPGVTFASNGSVMLASDSLNSTIHRFAAGTHHVQVCEGGTSGVRGMCIPFHGITARDGPVLGDNSTAPIVERTRFLYPNDTLGVFDEGERFTGMMLNASGKDAPAVADGGLRALTASISEGDSPSFEDTSGADTTGKIGEADAPAVGEDYTLARTASISEGDSPSFEDVSGTDTTGKIGETDAPAVDEDYTLARTASISEGDSPSFEDVSGTDTTGKIDETDAPAVDEDHMLVRIISISKNDILTFEERDGVDGMASRNPVDRPAVSDPVRLEVLYFLSGDDSPAVLDVPRVNSSIGDVSGGGREGNDTLAASDHASLGVSRMASDRPVIDDTMDTTAKNGSRLTPTDAPDLFDPARLAVRFFLSGDDSPAVLDVPGVGEIPVLPIPLPGGDSPTFAELPGVDVSAVGNATDTPAVADRITLKTSLQTSDAPVVEDMMNTTVEGMYKFDETDGPGIADGAGIKASLQASDAPVVEDMMDTTVEGMYRFDERDGPGITDGAGLGVLLQASDAPVVEDMMNTIVEGMYKFDERDGPGIADGASLGVLLQASDAPVVEDMMNTIVEGMYKFDETDGPGITDSAGIKASLQAYDAPVIDDIMNTASDGMYKVVEGETPGVADGAGIKVSLKASDSPVIDDIMNTASDGMYKIFKDDTPGVRDAGDAVRDGMYARSASDMPVVKDRAGRSAVLSTGDSITVSDAGSAKSGISVSDGPTVGDGISRGVYITVFEAPTVADYTPRTEAADVPEVSDSAAAEHARIIAPGVEPRPVPRSSGGGGGGGSSGLSPTGSSLGYSASFDFTTGGANVLAGASVRPGPGLPLVITPLLDPATLTVYDMEIRLSDMEGTAAEVYYNRLGAFYGKECGGEMSVSSELYTCDVSSAISGAATHVKSGGALDSISIPLQEGFFGTMTLMLRDNQGLTLADHERTYTVGVRPIAQPVSQTGVPPAPEPATPPAPVQEPPEDAHVPAPPEPGARAADPAAPPRTDPGAIPGTDPEPAGSPDERGILDGIIDFVRSLLGL